MIVKEYTLQCDIKTEVCGDEYTRRRGTSPLAGWTDQTELRTYAQRRGWRAVASRENDVVRMKDACPECAAITPGAV